MHRGLIFLCEALEGPGMGKVIMPKYIFRVRAWRALCIAAEEFPWLLFWVPNNQPRYISHLFSDCNCILYGKFTKAACRLPDVPRKLTVLEMCALVSLTLMSSCLWEQALVLWVLDESCCSECKVALATKPVKTPHLGPYRVLSGSHHTCTLRDVSLFHWHPMRGQY